MPIASFVLQSVSEIQDDRALMRRRHAIGALHLLLRLLLLLLLLFPIQPPLLQTTPPSLFPPKYTPGSFSFRYSSVVTTVSRCGNRCAFAH